MERQIGRDEWSERRKKARGWVDGGGRFGMDLFTMRDRSNAREGMGKGKAGMGSRGGGKSWTDSVSYDDEVCPTRLFPLFPLLSKPNGSHRTTYRPRGVLDK